RAGRGPGLLDRQPGPSPGRGLHRPWAGRLSIVRGLRGGAVRPRGDRRPAARPCRRRRPPPFATGHSAGQRQRGLTGSAHRLQRIIAGDAYSWIEVHPVEALRNRTPDRYSEGSAILGLSFSRWEKTDWSEAAMKTIVLALLGVAGSLVLMAVAVAAAGFLDVRPPASREQCDKLAQQGNHKDAYEGYRALALDPKDDPTLVGRDLKLAISCLTNLGRTDEIDAFREAVIQVHNDNWRLLQSAAETYLNEQAHYGFIVAGEFHRGAHRGGGRYVSVLERDRVRALQLLFQGLEGARSNSDRPGVGRYLLRLAGALLSSRVAGESWRLQSLTPLDALPDFDESASQFWDGQQLGAPVEADGTPVYYRAPHDFSQAKNDGERWRWALAQAVEVDPGL